MLTRRNARSALLNALGTLFFFLFFASASSAQKQKGVILCQGRLRGGYGTDVSKFRKEVQARCKAVRKQSIMRKKRESVIMTNAN